MQIVSSTIQKQTTFLLATKISKGCTFYLHLMGKLLIHRHTQTTTNAVSLSCFNFLPFTSFVAYSSPQAFNTNMTRITVFLQQPKSPSVFLYNLRYWLHKGDRSRLFCQKHFHLNTILAFSSFSLWRTGIVCLVVFSILPLKKICSTLYLTLWDFQLYTYFLISNNSNIVLDIYTICILQDRDCLILTRNCFAWCDSTDPHKEI